MKHVHCELIKAWADGAEIQFLGKASKTWMDVKNPFWSTDTEYRIKPEPKILKYRAALVMDGLKDVYVFNCYTDNQVNSVDTSDSLIRWIDKDWIEVEYE